MEASDEERLFEEVLAHLRRDHRAMDLEETRVREQVAGHSYGYEFLDVYAGAAEPDEEFGPEPY